MKSNGYWQRKQTKNSPTHYVCCGSKMLKMALLITICSAYPPIHLSNCPPTHPFAHLPIHSPVWPHVRPFVSSHIHLHFRQPTHSSTRPPVHLPSAHMQWYACPSIHPFACPCACLSVHIPVHLLAHSCTIAPAYLPSHPPAGGDCMLPPPAH